MRRAERTFGVPPEAINQPVSVVSFCESSDPYESADKIEKDLPVISFDLDGVVFPRIGIQIGALWAYAKFLTYNKRYEPKREHLTSDERKVNKNPSLFQRLDTLRQGRRKVTPAFVRMFESMDIAASFGNSGRPFYEDMANKTIERLDEAGIGKDFSEAFFKPVDMKSSDETKYWALKDLIDQKFTNIYHFDDNARTIKRLSALLPEVKFVLFEDYTSSILYSRKEMEKTSNVARIKLRKNGKVEAKYLPPGFKLPFDDEILLTA